VDYLFHSLAICNEPHLVLAAAKPQVPLLEVD